ncbi:MAG: glycosyltransferase family 2 protein, partial [Acidobacteriota bacterium]
DQRLSTQVVGRDGVAVAIPAYQAARWIEPVITGVIAQRGAVLVIDDGSSDGTGDVAARAGAEVVRVPENRGKGHALRLAFKTLFGRGAEAVVTLDADGQHMPTEIPKLIDTWASSRAHLVLGTRDHLYAGMSTVRRFANTFSSRLISAVAGRTMLDIQTGFRLYSRELIDVVGFPEPRFEAESAVVVRTLRRGLEIATVPIELAVVDGRQSSHYRPLVDSGRIARAVAAARFERR